MSRKVELASISGSNHIGETGDMHRVLEQSEITNLTSGVPPVKKRLTNPNLSGT